MRRAVVTVPDRKLPASPSVPRQSVRERVRSYVERMQLGLSRAPRAEPRASAARRRSLEQWKETRLLTNGAEPFLGYDDPFADPRVEEVVTVEYGVTVAVRLR